MTPVVVFRPMRPLLLALCLALWGVVGGCGGAASPSVAAKGVVGETVEGTAERAEHPVFMWRTESATAVVYLLGSIHVGTKEMYPLDPRIEAAFDDAEVLVLEIDMDDEAATEAALAFVKMALLPKGQELDQLLDVETRVLLHTRLQALGVAYDNVKMFRPWFVGLTLGMKELEEAGYSGEYGIDNHFRQRAVAANKEIMELESVAEQAAIFAALTEDAESDDLRMVLEQDDIGDELAPMTRQWLRGETTLIAGDVEETRREYPDAYEALYAARNRAMTEKIEAYLQTSRNYFVIAGSAHMVGEEGIVALLRKRGYAVTQQ